MSHTIIIFEIILVHMQKNTYIHGRLFFLKTCWQDASGALGLVLLEHAKILPVAEPVVSRVVVVVMWWSCDVM